MNQAHEIVSLKDVWFYYDELPVLEDVSLSIKTNDFLGIIGPNGGGKTTLLNVILGLYEPLKGSVTVFGKSPRQVRENIGYVPQKTPFDRDFPIKVWDVVLMGRLSKRRMFAYYTEEDRAVTVDALKQVDMLDFKDRHIGKLSEGQKQRVFIARALTTEPELLLLDEPTSSVDVCIQESMYELLAKLKQSMAIVLVSHDIGVISQHVDKIACLNRRLYYHDSKEIDIHDLKAAYQCPIDIIAHGMPHRVMEEHDK